MSGPPGNDPAADVTGHQLRPLSAGEVRAFAGLGLPAGSWAPLFAIPLLEAWRQSGRTMGTPSEPAGDPVGPALQAAHARSDLIERLSAAAAEAVGPVSGAGDVGRDIRVFLDRRFPPEALVDSSHADTDNLLATQLLCWHLATDYAQPADRDAVLARLQARGAEILGNSTDVTGGLRPLIYRFLTVPSFDVDATSALAFRADGTPGSLKGPKDPGSLIAGVVADLYAQHGTASGFTAAGLVRRLGWGEEVEEVGAGDPLQAVMNPIWLHYLHSLEDLSPEEMAEERVSRDERLVAWLATLDYPLLHGVLDGIGAFIHDRMVDGPAPELVVASTDRYLRTMRYRVEALRSSHRIASVADAAQTIVPAATDPVPLPGEADETPAPKPASADGEPAPNRPVPVSPMPSSPFAPPVVRLAEPFTTVPWEEIRERSRTLGRSALDGTTTGMLFAPSDHGPRRVTIVRDEADVPTNLWFIGDLHADLLALANAWRYVHDRADGDGGPPHVLFLGDFVDRGVHSHETLLWLFDLMQEHGDRVGVIAGNHDEAYHFDDATGRFVSGTDPAEYPDELNAAIADGGGDRQLRVEVGKAAQRFFARCPRAVFLPDGLMVAHAGFPHVDMLERLTELLCLDEPDVLADFVWLRASRVPRKRPNRTTRGCEFGYENFAQFCQVMHRLGVPVNRLLRGHDHLPERYSNIIPAASPPITTINTMCRWLSSEWAEEAPPLACIARYVPGELPEVHQLPIDPREVDRANASAG